jgi:hypothetical protein
MSIFSSNITDLETNTIIVTNTTSLTNVQTGGILVSTSNAVLDKLNIGPTNYVLHSNIETSQPSWNNMETLLPRLSNISILEQAVLFTNTTNITTLTTGDILYGHDTHDLRRFARETTANNTHLRTGIYATGWGRTLRVNERGEDLIWLHPTSNLNYSYQAPGEPYPLGTPIEDTISIVPFMNAYSISGHDYMIINVSTGDITKNINNRIRVGANNFDVRLEGIAFFSNDGVRFMDTIGYDGTSTVNHPNNIKFHFYTLGKLRTNYYYHGDGSKLVFPEITPPSIGIITNPLLKPPTYPTTYLGKGGYLELFSDRRLKTNINAIIHALDKLTRLSPKIYKKGGVYESGFVAQEMYYDVREMRHIVWPGIGANPNDDAPEDDYSDWGENPVCLKYLQFIPYVIKSIQELRERVELLKNNRM